MSMPANNESRGSDPDATTLLDTVENESLQQKQDKQKRPVRELSQASIASFFYGTLQLLTTAIGAVLVLSLEQVMKSFQPSTPTTPTDLNGLTGTEGVSGTDLAEMQKMIEELGITSPDIPVPTQSPDATVPDVTTDPISPTLPTMPSVIPESSPSEIVPVEILVILGTTGFGIMGVLTAIIAFRAVSKGKSGLGLAMTGLMSSLISFGIACTVALAI